MVVSAREEASKIGAKIMQKGGNAFDAMVATELALAVAYPYGRSFEPNTFDTNTFEKLQTKDILSIKK
jgi:hypothetical protein